jgi:pyruvate/2-oxoglutarate dehydrogenase complex dihydrolipoamide dehydrogenase (E3) component
MQSKYDIIVIGSGSAGLSVSMFTARTRLKTLLIDKTAGHLGGDCLNFGCVPSKALIHVSKLIRHARLAADFGLSVSGDPDLAKVFAHVQDAQSKIRQHENPAFLRAQGIDLAFGTASFISEKEVKVSDTVYTAKRIVIATGSRPTRPAIKGLEKIKTITNETIFDLQQLPRHVVVLGGGPVGIELGQALSRLGSEVTIITRAERILPADPEATTSVLFQELKKEGIKFILNAEVEEFLSSSECRVRQGEDELTVHFDAVLLAAGRTLNIDELNLESAGVKTRDGKIVIDKTLRTTNKRIFVCGDVAGKLKFSHEAERQGRILLNNFFSPFKKTLNERYKSWVTFSDPQLATFGLSVEELREKSIPFETLIYSLKDDDRGVTDQYEYGKIQLHISKSFIRGRERLLGGSVVAPNAGEMIQELIVVMQTRAPIDLLFQKIYPYPVASRASQLAVVRHKEKVLTPSMASLLRALYRMI